MFHVERKYQDARERNKHNQKIKVFEPPEKVPTFNAVTMRAATADARRPGATTAQIWIREAFKECEATARRENLKPITLPPLTAHPVRSPGKSQANETRRIQVFVVMRSRARLRRKKGFCCRSLKLASAFAQRGAHYINDCP